MNNFKDYEVEFYAWGGEPFLLDGTYEVVKGWNQYEHVISGSRIDTNMAFAEKIADRVPSDKLKLTAPGINSITRSTSFLIRLED